MAPSITIVVPTIGRPSLSATLRSFADELSPEDHVFVAADGDDVGDLVRNFANDSVAQWTYSHWGERLGHWGHPIRNLAFDQIETDYVWTIDDDDVAAPFALNIIRETEADWAIYKMHFGDNHPASGITCWREPILRHGDIGTPMIVAKPGNSRFGHRYEGDWDYAQRLYAEYGEPDWDERVIALIRP